MTAIKRKSAQRKRAPGEPRKRSSRPPAKRTSKKVEIRPDEPRQIESGFPARNRRWEILMIVSLLAGILWAVFSRVPSAVGAPLSSSPSPRQGFLAPDFSLDTLEGDQVMLSALRGKIVVVNLWATWCQPCRAETPALQKAYEQYQVSGVLILGVNLTNQDALSDVRAFVQEFGLTYPILLDRDGRVGNLYRLQGIPTTFFIDRSGIIRTVVVGGPMSETFIRSRIEALLKEVQ